MGLPSHLPVRARELLEMERNTLRMFTSCGWFFDDLAGLETVVCLRYAARAIELAGPDAAHLEAGFLRALEVARSNDPGAGPAAMSIDRRCAAGDPATPRRRGLCRAPVGGAGAVRPPSAPTWWGRTDRASLRCSTAAPATAGRCAAEVRRPDGAIGGNHPPRGIARDGKTFPLGRLPEYEREQIRLALRRSSGAECSTPEEDRRIAEGPCRSTGPSGSRWCGSCRPIPAAPEGSTSTGCSRTLDLLALEEQTIPFDAQTRFYRLVTQGARETRRASARWRSRFGFDVDRAAMTEPVAE